MSRKTCAERITTLERRVYELAILVRELRQNVDVLIEGVKLLGRSQSRKPPPHELYPVYPWPAYPSVAPLHNPPVRVGSHSGTQHSRQVDNGDAKIGCKS